MNEAQFIEFDFVAENQDSLVIYGEKNGFNVKFKAVDQYGRVVPKSRLTNFDVEAINDLIYENTVEEINFESDFFDRSSE
jgi:hypothetical protein